MAVVVVAVAVAVAVAVVAVAIVVLAAMAGSGESDETKSDTSDTEVNLTCYSPLHTHTTYLYHFLKAHKLVRYTRLLITLFRFISFENIATVIQYSECYLVPYIYALFIGDYRSIALTHFSTRF